MQRMMQLRTPILVLLTAILVLFSAGDLAAGVTRGACSGPIFPGDHGGSPDTLWGGPSVPGHDGDPNDYDKSPPTEPVWLWLVSWLVGVGR